MFETFSQIHGRPAVFVDQNERQLTLLLELCESCGAYDCIVDQEAVPHEYFLVEFDGEDPDWYSVEDLFKIFKCR